MVAPSVTSVSTQAQTVSSAYDVTISKPTLADDDLLIAVVGTDHNTFIQPTGTDADDWLPVSNHTRITEPSLMHEIAHVSAAVFWKRVPDESTEPSEYKFGWSDEERGGVVLYRIANASTYQPIHKFAVSNESTATTSHECPSVVTDEDDCLIVRGTIAEGNVDGNSPPAGHTEDADFDANDITFYCSHKTEATATTVAAANHATTSNQESVSFTLAISPVAIHIEDAYQTQPNTMNFSRRMYAKFTDGVTGLLNDGNILGEGFGATQGSGKVELSDTSDYATATKVEQTIGLVGWSDNLIAFRPSLGSLNVGTNYLWVTNNAGDRTAPLEVEVYGPDGPSPADFFVQRGTFTTPTSTGNTDVITGLPFKPVAIRMWGVVTETSGTVRPNAGLWVGFACKDGSNGKRACIATNMQNSTANNDRAGKGDSCIIMMSPGGGTTFDVEATTANFQDDKLTLNFTTVSGTNEYIVHYEIFGGKDCEADIAEEDIDDTSTPRGISGLSFAPDVVFAANMGVSLPATTSSAYMSHGVACIRNKGKDYAPIQQNCWTWYGGTASSNANRHGQLCKGIFQGQASSNGWIWGAGVYRFTDDGILWRGLDADEAYFLLIKCGGPFTEFEVGMEAKSMATAVAEQTVDTQIEPHVVSIASSRRKEVFVSENETVTDDGVKVSMGSWSSTSNQSCVTVTAIADANNVDMVTITNRALRISDSDCTAESEIEIKDNLTGTNFDIDWVTNDTTSGNEFQFSWWAVEEGQVHAKPDFLDGGNVYLPSFPAPPAEPEFLDGGAIYLPQVGCNPQFLSGGEVYTPQCGIAVDFLDGGQVYTPQCGVALDFLSGGQIYTPQCGVAVDFLDGGAYYLPAVAAPLVAEPQFLDGGQVYTPQCGVALDFLSGGQVYTPQCGVAVSFLSGGAVYTPQMPALVPALDGGTVYTGRADEHKQVLDGGAVYTPTVALSGVSPQFLSGGQVYTPQMPALVGLLDGGELYGQQAREHVATLDGGAVYTPQMPALVPLLSGGEVYTPQAGTSLVAFLDGGATYLPTISADLMLEPPILDGGATYPPQMPALVPALDGGAVYTPLIGTPLDILDGGEIYLPGVGIAIQFLSGGAVYTPQMPALVPILTDGAVYTPRADEERQILDGGEVFTPFIGQVFPQVLDGGAVYNPQMPALVGLLSGGQLYGSQAREHVATLDGGAVYSPSVGTSAPVLDGGEVFLPTVPRLVPVLDGGQVYTPDPMLDSDLTIDFLDGGAVYTPGTMDEIGLFGGNIYNPTFSFVLGTFLNADETLTAPSRETSFTNPVGAATWTEPDGGSDWTHPDGGSDWSQPDGGSDFTSGAR